MVYAILHSLNNADMDDIYSGINGDGKDNTSKVLYKMFIWYICSKSRFSNVYVLCPNQNSIDQFVEDNDLSHDS